MTDVENDTGQIAPTVLAAAERVFEIGIQIADFHGANFKVPTNGNVESHPRVRRKCIARWG